MRFHVIALALLLLAFGTTATTATAISGPCTSNLPDCIDVVSGIGTDGIRLVGRTVCDLTC